MIMTTHCYHYHHQFKPFLLYSLICINIFIVSFWFQYKIWWYNVSSMAQQCKTNWAVHLSLKRIRIQLYSDKTSPLNKAWFHCVLNLCLLQKGTEKEHKSTSHLPHYKPPQRQSPLPHQLIPASDSNLFFSIPITFTADAVQAKIGSSCKGTWSGNQTWGKAGGSDSSSNRWLTSKTSSWPEIS